jgi:cobaltochelatase CobN
MASASIVHQVVSAELKGAAECLVAGGTESGGDSGEAIVPIPDRIRHIADRTEAWIALSKTPNSDKRIAVITYDREADKSSLMSGPAHALNAPRSMVKFLKSMEAAGYDISALPEDETGLLDRMVDHGRQMGAWEPAALDELARSGKAVLIPLETYQAWFEEKVSHRMRAEVVKEWGQAPGDLMVWEYSGEKYLVLPRIDMGNVVLMAQPPKGETITASTVDESLSENLLPPTHHWLATYFWIQEEFKANAVVHFGSHGSEWLFPGKMAGLSRDDWSDILLGRLPNINPWLSSNISEHTNCKRRAMAVTVDFMPPPLMDAGLSDDLLNLESNITKYLSLGDGALKTKFAEAITRQVRDSDLDINWFTQDRAEGAAGDRSVRVQKLQSMLGLTVDETEIGRISVYLHDLKNEQVPASMHILGEAPSDDLLLPYLVTCMGDRFLKEMGPLFSAGAEAPDGGGDLKKKALDIVTLILRQGFTAEEAIAASGGALGEDGMPEAVREGLSMVAQMDAGVKSAHLEIDNILAALDGKFISPGPSGSPERNPGVLPTGRNMYVLNPEELPSRTSWELGTRLMREHLEKEKKAKGRYPKKIAFSLVPFTTYSDYGIVESQILYLLGMRPVWDSKNRVRDVEIIPAAELGRPRIDVFISVRSVYRDELPSLLKLIDKAIRTVAALDEEDNPIFRNSEAIRRQLAQKGFSGEHARTLSLARIFGSEPDEIIDSHNWFFYLTERTGEWETREDLLDVYLEHTKHVYTEGAWGEKVPEAFDAAIQDTETIFRSWYDQRDFVTGNKFSWWVDGTLSLAVKHLTGHEPDYLFVDVRDPDNAEIVDSRDALRKDLYARLLNPKWIANMMKEGYAGGSLLSKNTGNLLGWEIMREASVTDADWERLVDVYVRDSKNLGLREWFDANNPHAFQEMTVTMIETIRKGFWPADDETRAELVTAYAESVARHGAGGGIRAGGNEQLSAYVQAQLTAPGTPEMDALRDAYVERSREVTAPPLQKNGDTEQVRGNKMDHSVETLEDESRQSGNRHLLLGIAVAALLVVLIGFLWKPPGGRKKGAG